MKYFDLTIYEEEEDFFDDEDFTEVTIKEIYDQRRWATCYSQVFKYKDGTFWKASWKRGSTECQETDLQLSVWQVEPVQVTVTQYKAV